MENLKLRLTILKDSGQIDDEIEKQVLSFLQEVGKEIDSEINSDNASMLAMHVAMALSRIKKQETVNKVDDILIEQIINDQYYNEANEVLNSVLENLNITLPENEVDYFKMHLVTLLNKVKND